MRRILTILVLSAAVLALAGPVTVGAPPPQVAITNVRIFDGTKVIPRATRRTQAPPMERACTASSSCWSRRDSLPWRHCGPPPPCRRRPFVCWTEGGSRAACEPTWCWSKATLRRTSRPAALC